MGGRSALVASGHKQASPAAPLRQTQHTERLSGDTMDEHATAQTGGLQLNQSTVI